MPTKIRRYLNGRTHRAALACLWGMLTWVQALATPAIHGKLERVGPYRLLRLWGTPREMGFAHGYLIGSEFLEVQDAFLRSLRDDGRSQYERSLQSVHDLVQISDRNAEELQAIFDGIVAAHGAAPQIRLLNRTLTLDDLWYFNTLDVLRAFGCSGFTVWGPEAGDAGVIATRNFDWRVYGPEFVKYHIILVRQPTGRNQLATLTWPGYLGAFTGINEHGVAAFMHDGTGPRNRQPRGKYASVALTIKDLLERVVPRTATTQAREVFKRTASPFSYLIRLITPRIPDDRTPPVTVFRVDSQGLSTNPRGKYHCITTNHYLLPNGQPVDNADPWSLRRFKMIEESLDVAIDEDRAWNSLRAVALLRKTEPMAATLHSLVLYPEQRRVEITLATWEDELIPAPNQKPTNIDFDLLFGKGR